MLRLMPRSILIIAALSLTLLAATTAPAGADVVRPFSPTSFWNKPLAPDAPLDPKNQQFVDGLRWEAWAFGTWINTNEWSTPVYTVGPKQQNIKVKLDKYDPSLQDAFNKVPIPADAKPAAGVDAHLVVWQPSTDTMWEFWHAAKLRDGWHAAYGGRMKNVSSNPGHFTDPPGWGATATSLPLLGGLMRIDEIRQGRIDHALAMAIPLTLKGAWSWPAQRTDGNVDTNADAVPQGARFRIDPNLDLNTLQMDPLVRMMAEAAQRYGIVVRDTAGSVTFYGEDPTPTGSNPWGGFFGQKYPSELLAQFPWASLQALKTDMRTQAG